MTFEEKLSQMYNEIANKISSMIPVEWEKVYAMAYVNERSGEVFYTIILNQEVMNYFTIRAC